MKKKTFAVAPMMDWTDRHCRYFHRQISSKALLYSEMISSEAILYGNHHNLLQYNNAEHPIALQIGGGNPTTIAKAVIVADKYGYDEINFNVGCPSNRVQKGNIGAVLMANPKLVSDCFLAMQNNSKDNTKITIKSRLSINDMPEESIFNFVETVAKSGCKTFIIHARKAFLQGLNPKDNRQLPPLNYKLVYQVKEKFPELEIIINGGIKTLDEVRQHLLYVDGVMMGREAYQNPWILSKVDNMLTGIPNTISRQKVINNMLPYVEEEISKGSHIKHIVRHWMGLFNGQQGTKIFKRYLNDNINRNEVAIINEALGAMLG